MNVFSNRKIETIVSLILPILFVSLLFNCGRTPEKKKPRKITIRFWNGFTGPDGRTILRLIKRFNRENPDVQVLMQRMDWGIYYNKLFVAGLGGRAPEVFIVHAGSIERFMQAQFVREVDDLVKGDNGIAESDFAENIWQAVEKDGKHYALPLDVHPVGMYYNKKLFREAGIVDEQGNPKPPTNRAEFLEALTRITKDIDGDGKNDRWGYVFTWYRTNMYTFILQWGGRVFTPDLQKCVMDEPENVEAVRFFTDLIHKNKVIPPPENFDSWIGFRQGKVGIAFEGIYMLEDLKRQKDLDFGAAPLPLLGKVPAAWADSHTICFRKDLEGEPLDAAWRFAKYLSDNSLDWAEGGQIPARKSLLESERFKGMTAQFEFAKMIPYVRYIPRVPYALEFLGEFDNAAERGLRGNVSAETALAEAAANVNKIIKRQNEERKRSKP